MKSRFKRPVLSVLLTGVLLVGIFAAMVVGFRAPLREEIRQTIINRHAAALRPMALRQLAQRETAPGDPTGLLAAVLESIQQEDMLAVVIFDAQGHTLQFAPDSLLFAELPLDDYLRLLKAEPISRFHPDFPLDRYFAGIGAAPAEHPTPVLEVLLPLHGRDSEKILGFAQYYIDARPLAGELAAIDRRINRQTAATLGIGAALIAAVVTVAYHGLRRAHDRLVRANFELTLAVKASALGQITSHLIHGLQGSVAGLRAVVAGRDRTAAHASDWETIASYTDRMQAIIHEAVALLGDSASSQTHELTGPELAGIIRERNAAAVTQKGVAFSIKGCFDHDLDSHRGGLLCLITSNLVQNAIDATDAGRSVAVVFGNNGGSATVSVSDEGHGIDEELRAHLFEPGHSGRTGGSGLGLAISQLLARQIGATLVLVATGKDGTTFRVTLPLAAN
jgi:signal transduction histidine kinase